MDEQHVKTLEYIDDNDAYDYNGYLEFCKQAEIRPYSFIIYATMAQNKVVNKLSKADMVNLNAGKTIDRPPCGSCGGGKVL